MRSHYPGASQDRTEARGSRRTTCARRSRAEEPSGAGLGPAPVTHPRSSLWLCQWPPLGCGRLGSGRPLSSRGRARSLSQLRRGLPLHVTVQGIIWGARAGEACLACRPPPWSFQLLGTPCRGSFSKSKGLAPEGPPAVVSCAYCRLVTSRARAHLHTTVAASHCPFPSTSRPGQREEPPKEAGLTVALGSGLLRAWPGEGGGEP